MQKIIISKAIIRLGVNIMNINTLNAEFNRIMGVVDEKKTEINPFHLRHPVQPLNRFDLELAKDQGIIDCKKGRSVSTKYQYDSEKYLAYLSGYGYQYALEATADNLTRI